jgi:hypothetical protein
MWSDLWQVDGFLQFPPSGKLIATINWNILYNIHHNPNPIYNTKLAYRRKSEKTIDLSQVTDKLYHIMFKYTSPWTGFDITTVVVKGTDFTSSCKSNYHNPNPIYNTKLAYLKQICLKHQTWFLMSIAYCPHQLLDLIDWFSLSSDPHLTVTRKKSIPHNVQVHLFMNGVRYHNCSGERHWFHK